MLPCSAYAKSKVAYIVLDSKSRRYREYIRRSFSCYNMSSIPARSFNTLIKEEEKLKLEREAAFKVTIESITRVNRL